MIWIVFPHPDSLVLSFVLLPLRWKFGAMHWTILNIIIYVQCLQFAVVLSFKIGRWKWSHFETTHETSSQNELMMMLSSVNQLLRLPVSHFCENNQQRSSRQRCWIKQMIPLGTELKSRFLRSKLLWIKQPCF